MGRFWLAGAAAICVALAAFPAVRMLERTDRSNVSAAARTVNDGEAAPDFQLPDANGAAVHLEAFRGKVVVVNFWATWCGGCKVEIPSFAELAGKYAKSGLTVIGISMDEDGWKSVRPYLGEHPIPYPVVIGSPELAANYGLSAMPMTFVVGRDGKVAASHIGLVDRAAIEAEVVRALKR